ncbi:hypothetical protein GCM10010121_028580 [Streptomyces brasiliensis]|uniref:Uncharacterized protein n=1 Tax=Streptomyces brasiliensis TaxID=1954 RepID=A0A917KJ37_9ACTN|nr:hypothetical protein GCM10010121_028580 [Streptomyces brasiliensis]
MPVPFARSGSRLRQPETVSSAAAARAAARRRAGGRGMAGLLGGAVTDTDTDSDTCLSRHHRPGGSTSETSRTGEGS